MDAAPDRGETDLAPSARSAREAADAPVGLRRGVVSSFLVVMLGVMGIWGLPRFHSAQDPLVRWTDPVVTGLGLWQSTWELFGPQPDDMNVAISGVVHFEDGARAQWRSPDWRALSWAGKLRYFRHAEYVDGARRDTNFAAWAPLARHLGRTLRHPTDDTIRPVSVELSRHWTHIPEPVEPLRPFDDPFPLDEECIYHVESLE